MKVAVVGVGVAGLTAAHTLASAGIQVTLYEKEDYVGGHARTIHDVGIGLDTGFMVFNRVSIQLFVSMLQSRNFLTRLVAPESIPEFVVD